MAGHALGQRVTWYTRTWQEAAAAGQQEAADKSKDHEGDGQPVQKQGSTWSMSDSIASGPITLAEDGVVLYTQEDQETG